MNIRGSPSTRVRTGRAAQQARTRPPSSAKNSRVPAGLARKAHSRRASAALAGKAESSGQGVKAVYQGESVLLGNERLMKEHDINLDKFNALLDSSGNLAATPVLLARAGLFAGMLLIEDRIKKDSAATIEALHKLNIKTIMLSGDRQAAAEAVAASVGIDEVIAQVLPDEKEQVIRNLQASGEKLAMVGDGLNDAPSLARADVGFAVGSGTDVAIESATITLVKGDLRGIVKAKKLSHGVVKNIRQNLFFAFVYNVLGVPIAAGVLYPIFGVLLSPMIAALAMSFSSVSVIANSLRLRTMKI